MRIVDLEEKLRRQATHDALTGILNRGAIMARLGVEMARAYRDGEKGRDRIEFPTLEQMSSG
jgi:GGDEF domain-containing protein